MVIGMKLVIVTPWVIAYRESPTRVKVSQQLSSEIHVQTGYLERDLCQQGRCVSLTLGALSFT
jgi:hypothetical protein